MNTATSNRGDQTRIALIEAATAVFGKAGFDAASTRAIAQQAGANQALINYHFGSKEGLYQAVVETICGDMERTLGPALEHLSLNMPTDHSTAITAIHELLSAMIEQFGRDELQDWSRIIAREQQDPTPAFEAIYEGFMRRILEALTLLVTVASAGEIQGETARLRASYFLGQVLIFVYAPAAMYRYLEWTALDVGQRDAIREQLFEVVRCQFKEYAQ
jgi:TetR/AcrR family transcriptional regulator, regulator of cefoperazone and chloramphenicol sensitivity